ncbi:MAG: ABC transporter ATP-binding protein/permease [Lachnospiraceae bacterium]|nr:ABC transporter ATP-binding protein/permease [Lachnospiraceae bacterium]
MDNKLDKQGKKSWMRWLWGNMQGHRVLYVFAILMTIVYNIMQLVVPYFSGEIVSLFQQAGETGTPLTENLDDFIFNLAMMVGLTLVRITIVYFTCMAYEYVSQHTLYKLRNFLFDKIEHQDMNFYNEYRTGDLMTRLTGDLDAVRHNVAWVIKSVVDSFALFVATAIYFFIMDWLLALCILSITPLLFLVILKFKRASAEKHRILRDKLSGLNTDAQENISGNRVVKAFAREEYEKEKFNRSNTSYAEANMDTQRTWLKYFPVIETFANLLPVILLLAGGIFIINGRIGIPEYVSFSMLIWAVANPMRQLGNIMNEFQRFAAASKKVMEIYNSQAGIVSKPDAVKHPDRFKGLIEFDHVSFGYEGGSVPVLRDINLKIEPGQTVAIIGETGCGKTSLIHMIPRFYDPESGVVKIDGIDVKDYELTDLRHNIGLATQDVLLYSDTIEGNIAYGDSSLSQDEVIKYARYSAAEEFINKMPEGYETIVGERGVGLSGGQKQRISLARALAIKPSILILDDTTSAVDMETEKHIRDSLHELDFNCTKIIIAQRISTTKFCDRIFVMGNGRIIEEGTHKELCSKGGYYASLVALQTGIGLSEAKNLYNSGFTVSDTVAATAGEVTR